MKLKIANLFNESRLSRNSNLTVIEDLRKLWNDYDRLKEKSKKYNTKLKTVTLKVLGLRFFNFERRNSFILKNSKIKKSYKKINAKNNGDDTKLLKTVENLLFLNLKAIDVTEQLYEDVDDLKALFLKSCDLIKRQNEGLKIASCDRTVTRVKDNNYDVSYGNFNSMNKVLFIPDFAEFLAYSSMSRLISITNNYCTKASYPRLTVTYEPEKVACNESSNVQSVKFPIKDKQVVRGLKVISQLLEPRVIFVDQNYISTLLLKTSQQIISFGCPYFHKNTSSSDMEEISREYKSIRSAVHQPIELRSITNVSLKKTDFRCAVLPHFALTIIDGYNFFTGDFHKLFTLLPMSKIFNESTLGNQLIQLEEKLEETENEKFCQLSVVSKKDEIECLNTAIEEKFDHYLNRIRYNLEIEKPFQATQHLFLKNELDKALENNLFNLAEGSIGDKNAYPTLSFCEKSRIDNLCYLPPVTRVNSDNAIQTDPGYNGYNERIERVRDAYEETFSEKTASSVADSYNDSHRRFKNSLRNLEQIVQECKKSSEQQSTSNSYTSSRSPKKLKSLRKENFLFQSDKSVNSKKKNQQKNQNINKKNYASFTMPEMSKTYQIVLQNKVNQGLNFQFITYNRGNVQILMLSKPQIVNNSKIKRKKF